MSHPVLHTTKRDQIVRELFDSDPDNNILDSILSILDGTTSHREDSVGFMSIADGAKYASISRSNFYLWIKQGLRTYRVNRRRLVKAEDIDQFIIERNCE